MKKILIVDDDRTLRTVLTRYLENRGYQVEQVSSGAEALVAFAKNPPDLVVSDVMMPEMDGFAFLRTLRAKPEWGSIPVVVLTAKDVDGEDRRRLAGQADRVLRKGQVGLDDLPNLLRPFVLPKL